MVGVSHNYGCVISTTTVVMTPMNPPTCADRGIVQQGGNVAQVNLIIGAYRNGYSVMEKMIVAIIVMNCQKIVHNARQIPISSAPTTDAYQSK